MIRRPVSTPCPIPASLDQLLTLGPDDTTTTLDFTTDLRASFKSAKPKRRSRQSVQFAIHEDEAEQHVVCGGPSTTLSQPPRRMHTTTGSQAAVTGTSQLRSSRARIKTDSFSCQISETPKLGQAPRRPAARLSSLPEQSNNEQSLSTTSPPTQVIRPARRGTIYIPNEDTTMPTMYMGVFSPIKDVNLQSVDVARCEGIEMTGIAAQMANKKMSRRSMLVDAPRRGILRPSLKVAQESACKEDRHGQGGGKENIPPGAPVHHKLSSQSSTKVVQTSPKVNNVVNRSRLSVERASIHAPTASSTLKHASSKASSSYELAPKPAWNRGTMSRQSQPVPVLKRTDKPQSVPPPISALATPKPPVPTRFVVPVIQIDTTLQQHPVLHEEISNPALYEEDWLQHQEAALTQLVNNLFSACRPGVDCEQRSLRSLMLEKYNSSTSALLYKRLQAALLYGALGIPQDTLEQGKRLQNDVGLKKNFVDLWVKTYNHEPLIAALEVVVGRECNKGRLPVSAECSPLSQSSKSGLHGFIEAFLIRNEDARPGPDHKSHIAWSYHRAVLRSLLLIKLLDLTKTDPDLARRGCLFQHTSPYKNSVEVVQALIQMLNPAAGDPVRALNHIDYNVSHVQNPLEEYNYHIDNLAVDIRDGIRLTRLVELLLHPSCSQSMEKKYDSGTTTLLMPEGQSLELLDGQDWPLSQHLKMATTSRAVKIWNVELALSAIQTVKGVSASIQGITAEDIVDGFREKTIRLLWALVGKWGLVGLLNWQDLRWEIRRLKRSVNIEDINDKYDDDTDLCELSFETCKALLKRWARAVASLRGVEVRNFTTSFADGAAFEAIVNEYEPYVQTDRLPSIGKASLHDRLVHLGCSVQFSQLFSEPKYTHVFDHDFVITALAFLCSRLLAPSRRARAATVIQQSWRRYWSKIEGVRKQEKSQIAAACANLVRSRQTLTPLVSNPELRELAPTLSTSINQLRCPMSPGEEDIWLNL